MTGRVDTRLKPLDGNLTVAKLGSLIINGHPYGVSELLDHPALQAFGHRGRR